MKKGTSALKVAYLIDRESIGGGMEFIRVKRALRPQDEAGVFFSSRGECRIGTVCAWRPDDILVVHLRALLQLLWNPLAKPCAPVTFAVLGMHIRKYDHLPRTWANRARRIMRRELERYLYRRCARILVQNRSDAELVRQLYGQDMPVEIDRPSLGEWTPPAARPQEKDCAYVYVARFEFQKGQDRWLKHVYGNARELRRLGQVTVFVGNGTTLAEAAEYVASHGIADLVRFVGETKEIEDYLLRAQVVVSASRWEGYPYLLMKARALGCRILATDCPGNRDVLAGYDKWEKLEL